MPGKVLIIDDVATNRIVLLVKLSAAGYSVTQAANGAEGLALARAEKPDIVLCPTRLPDRSVLDFLKTMGDIAPRTQTATIVLTGKDGAENNLAERLALLKAGAHDVVARPPDIGALLARFRAILRNRESDEDALLHRRMSRVLGLSEQAKPFAQVAQVSILAKAVRRAEVWQQALQNPGSCHWSVGSFDQALPLASSKTMPDVVVVDATDPDLHQALSLLSDLRAGSTTRTAKTIAVLREGDPMSVREALDRGADDVLVSGFHAEELLLRLERLIKAKQRENERRANMHEGLRAATTDPLTGLHNRRFAMPHLARVAQDCVSEARTCAVMVIDVDHFKSVNDRFGHEAGDATLVELASLLKQSLRAGDIASRIGGEEFMIVLPNTSVAEAQSAARRLCGIVSAHPFKLPNVSEPLNVTVSIGVAVAQKNGALYTQTDQMAEALFREADIALYGSKSQGRNQVTLSPKSAA